jgi:hypothetical protein
MGTAQPLHKLHVNEGNLFINESGYILFGDANDNLPEKWGIEYLNSGNNAYGLNFFNYFHHIVTPPVEAKDGTHYSVLFLSNNHEVGIGNKNPQATLDVTGSFKAQSANITGPINAQSATIAKTLTANALSAQSATITGAITAGGAFSAQSANITGAITAQSANIAGKIKTKEVEVTLADWPDFVFEKDYNLLPLNEVAQYIKQNNRLPNIPSAAEVESNGIELGEMNAKLLQKVEELTLYILDLQNQINELKKQ